MVNATTIGWNTTALKLVSLVCMLSSQLSICFQWQTHHEKMHRQLRINSYSSSSRLAMRADDQYSLKLMSPCKLNLFLRILGKLPSGYHELASLFQTISLSDYLFFSKLPDGATQDVLHCTDPTLTVDGNNLVLKALDLMRRKTGLRTFLDVKLQKHVPIQAGLGGGSGNAATAMQAFNMLCGYPASNADLVQWSGDIGSDISFFFSTGTAYCTGRGENVESKPALPDASFIDVHVFKPSFGLSTALVFKAFKLSETSNVVPESLLDCFETGGALKAAAEGRFVNDLEAPAFANEPTLAAIKQCIIDQHGDQVAGVMMSGSGTSVFALVDRRQAATKPFDYQHVLQQFSQCDLRHFKCEFVSRSNDARAWY